MFNRVKNLISELRFVYGVKKPTQKKTKIKGWNTLSAKQINQIRRQQELSR